MKYAKYWSWIIHQKVKIYEEEHMESSSLKIVGLLSLLWKKPSCINECWKISWVMFSMRFQEYHNAYAANNAKYIGSSEIRSGGQLILSTAIQCAWTDCCPTGFCCNWKSFRTQSIGNWKTFYKMDFVRCILLLVLGDL